MTEERQGRRGEGRYQGQEVEGDGLCKEVKKREKREREDPRVINITMTMMIMVMTHTCTHGD